MLFLIFFPLPKCRSCIIFLFLAENYYLLLEHHHVVFHNLLHPTWCSTAFYIPYLCGLPHKCVCRRLLEHNHFSLTRLSKLKWANPVCGFSKFRCFGLSLFPFYNAHNYMNIRINESLPTPPVACWVGARSLDLEVSGSRVGRERAMRERLLE